MATPVVNHVGLVVTDLERAVRFWSEAFGFTEQRRLDVPDEPAGQLLQVEPPLGMTAVYLLSGGLTLELMSFEREGNAPYRVRPFTEPGLTHLSLCVDDLAEAKAKVVELGGSVVDGTDVGGAVMVRDPDGQLIELLPMEYRRWVTPKA